MNKIIAKYDEKRIKENIEILINNIQIIRLKELVSGDSAII